MDICTDDDEIVKLLDVKDIEVIDPNECTEQAAECIRSNGNHTKGNDFDTENKVNGIIAASTERRSDEPTELSFEKGMWKCINYFDFAISGAHEMNHTTRYESFHSTTVKFPFQSLHVFEKPD